MKKKLTLFLSVLCLLATMISCKKDAKDKSCDFSTEPFKTTKSMDVLYKVEISGDAVVNSLIYNISPTESVTVPNPELPWIFKGTVDAGTNVSIHAIGSAKNGYIRIRYMLQGQGEEASDSTSCENYHN